MCDVCVRVRARLPVKRTHAQVCLRESARILARDRAVCSFALPSLPFPPSLAASG